MILKKFILSLALVFPMLATFAQDTDSIQVVKTKWEKKRIAPQVILYRHHFKTKDLFAANENISFLEVKNNGRRALLKLAAEKQELKTTSTFGQEQHAIAAINGNFFDVKNGGAVDFTKVDGTIVNTTRLETNGERARHQRAAVVIDQGKIAIRKWDGSSDWENQLPEPNVMLTGPLLRLNQVDEQIDTADFNRLRHPRTCLGIKPNGRAILLTVDGRNEQSAGMSLFELTKLMRWLGCSSIINLDGGGSTTLWIKGEGVVNYPSDNKKWDHEGQRKVANVIMIKNR